MTGLLSPLCRGFLHHPVDMQPGWQGARSPGTQWPLSPGSPRATFVWEPPGWWEQGLTGQCLHPDTACIHGSSGTRAPGGPVLPQPGQQNEHSGQRAGSCPRQTRVACMAGGTWHFPTGLDAHNARLVVSPMCQTCYSHTAVLGSLWAPQEAEGSEWCILAKGIWTCPGWSFPSWNV